jgi:hypothetical protein
VATKAKKKKPIISKDVLLEALNRMDEFASAYVVDNNEIREGFGEADQLQEDYDLLHDFISNLKASAYATGKKK